MAEGGYEGVDTPLQSSAIIGIEECKKKGVWVNPQSEIFYVYPVQFSVWPRHCRVVLFGVS